MALVELEELKASREAVEAGVDDADEAFITQAIEDAELALYAVLGYRIEFEDTEVTVRGSGEDHLVLPQHALSVTEVVSDDVAVESTTYSLASGWVLQGALWTGKSIVVTGTFGFDEVSDTYKRAKRVVLKLAVRYLQSGKVAPGSPNTSGAYLTSYSSQQAQFTYFTPTGELTGFQDLDRLVMQIGLHPFKVPNLLRSVPVS